MLTSEISMSFNIVITIIFWSILVPQIIHGLPTDQAADPAKVCPYADSWLSF